MKKTLTLVSFAIATMLGTASASAAKLKDILNPNMLMVDVAYFESKVGVARNSSDDSRLYRVGKCDISVGTKGGVVQWFEVDNTPQCAFDPYQFIYNYDGKKTPLSKMTFGTFEDISQGKGTFFSSCISSCGNAADPVVYEQWEGSRADGFIELRVEAEIVGLDALGAFGDLRDFIAKKETDDWMMWNEFSCSTDGQKYFGVARQLFKDIRVSTITVGHGIPKPYICK